MGRGLLWNWRSQVRSGVGAGLVLSVFAQLRRARMINRPVAEADNVALGE